MSGLRAKSVYVVVVLSLGLAVPGLSACSSSDEKTVDVSLIDYEVLPKVTSIDAGEITFKVKNNGTFLHEFVVDKGADAAALPTKPDGEVNEDDIPESDHLGEIEDIEPGSTKTLKLTLPAGKYVFFCNRVDGKIVHYMKGMRVNFTVK
jgi:uncharacterized cupredoxin-like copper-binding protein